MEKPFTLLLATDYSEIAANAERYAVKFALDTNSFLRFIHVFHPPAADQVGAFDPDKIDYNPVQYEFKKLKLHAAKILQDLNVQPGTLNYECVIREGSAGKQIREEAEDVFHDFIIMGTHGAGEFRRLFLGSHTWDVIKKSGTPVLAIPQNAVYKEIESIAFATEYREGELPVINFLTQTAAQFNANLTVLHITEDETTEKFEKKIYEDFINELKDKIVYPNLKMQVAHYDNIISGLNDFCVRSSTDWLVMSHEKLSFLEKILDPSSVSRQMSFQTVIPLLSIPDYYNPNHEWFWKLFAIDYSLDTDF